MQVRDYSVFLFFCFFIVDFAVVARINEKEKMKPKMMENQKRKKK